MKKPWPRISAFKTLIKKELTEDAEKYGDKRRTLIVERQEARAIKEVELTTAEPATVVLSAGGWVRAARRHDIDPAGLPYKAGDEFLSAARGKTIQPSIFLDTRGKGLFPAGPHSGVGDGDTANR